MPEPPLNLYVRPDFPQSQMAKISPFTLRLSRKSAVDRVNRLFQFAGQGGIAV